MAARAEIEQQLARESRFRRRLGVPAFLGGALYLASAIVTTSTLSHGPTVGLLQGLAPALRGEAEPQLSPRAEEIRFISHHSFALILASALATAAVLILTAATVALLGATRFRRPETWPPARPVLLAGGIAFAVIGLAHQVAAAIAAHNFTMGHDFTNRAVESVVRTGTVNVALGTAAFVAGLALAIGMVATMMNAMRVGLLTRWLGVVGIVSGFLLFLGIGGPTLEIIPAFWLAALGILYMGRWPGGEPPAWAAGEARPWPTQAERLAEREEAAGAPRRGAPARKPPAEPEPETEQEPQPVPAEIAPAPAPPAAGTPAAAKRRRRKRGARP